MKKFLFPRCLTTVMTITVTLVFLISCNSSTNSSSYEIKGSKDRSSSWYSDGAWLHGLDITPNKNINQEEFSRQYLLKNNWRDKAFNFLKPRDLKILPRGKYNIDSGNVFATVWEGVPKTKDSVLWEAHHNFNDLQYIILGKAEMGITPIDDPNVKIAVPFSKEEDIKHFTVSAGDRYYLADSSTFFNFSPTEMHRSCNRG